MRDIIYQKISQNFPQGEVEVINESSQHAGHMGDDGTGDSHFRIKLSDSSLKNQPRVKIHRKIYQILEQELKIIHALAIDLEYR